MKRFLLAGMAAASLTFAAHADEHLTSAQFVARASEAGMAEVELGKLAAQKGSAADIRAYGQQMVTDHTKANTELEQIAKQKSLQPAKAPGAAHARVAQELGAKSGKDFDSAFAAQMVKDHEEAVALFESASHLADTELAQYASRTLSTLREHHDRARHLDASH